jgi:hypothetical protein
VGTISATADAKRAEPSFRLKSFLVRSIMLGVLIALFSTPVRVFIWGMDGLLSGSRHLSPLPGPLPSVEPVATDLSLLIAYALIGAPLLESLVFPLVYWLTSRLAFARSSFVGLIGLVAWAAHGMQLHNLVHAAGFMLMAAWYVYLRERFPSPRMLSPVKIPYYGIVLAHAAWNVTALAWPLFWIWLWVTLGSFAL